MRRTLANDGRGVSEVVAVALLVGIVVLGVAAIVLIGGSQLLGTQEAAEVRQAEQSLTQFDAEASRVATGSTSSGAIDLGLRGNSGTLDVESDSGNITVEYVDNLHDSDRTEVVHTSLGAVVYESGDTTVGYQGGGVWRSDGKDSTMISPPEISFDDGTLTMPIIRTDRGGSVHSDVRIVPGNDPEQRFPNDSVEDANLTNKVDSGTLWITIESRYYRAWAQYFEEETNAAVYPGQPDDGHVTVIFYGSRMQFSPEAGIVATSGPGEIRLRGSQSDSTYIDSYNSSNGSYSETSSEDGLVKSSGDIDMAGNAEIRGSSHSDKRIMLDGSATITGDACAGDGVNNPDKVEGSTNCTPDVPKLPPLDPYVEAKTDELANTNDNDATDLIDNESDTLDFEGSEDDELAPGDYYLENIDLDNDDELILNATDGDLTIAVRNYVSLDEGNITVKGDNDDGTVQLFVASEGSSGKTVQLPGEGGQFEADHFFVGGDSHLNVENESSPRFQVIAPQHFRGAVTQLSGDSPEVTAAVVAPTLDESSGEFWVGKSDFYGAIVTGELNAENGAEIHFDHAIVDEDIPFGEGVSLLDYLYVTEHDLQVRGP